MRRDTPAVCIAFLFILGLIGLKSFTGAIMTVFNAILYAGKEFMEVLATIAMVTALSKCLKDLRQRLPYDGPHVKIMKTPSITWWILGLTMFCFPSFMAQPLGCAGWRHHASFLPLRQGSIPGRSHGHEPVRPRFALSYDFVIQGAPAVSAGATGITTTGILHQAWPVFWVMGIVTVCGAYLLNREMKGADWVPDHPDRGPGLPPRAGRWPCSGHPHPWLHSWAWIVLMLVFDLKGGMPPAWCQEQPLSSCALAPSLALGKDSLKGNRICDGRLPFAIKILPRSSSSAPSSF